MTHLLALYGSSTEQKIKHNICQLKRYVAEYLQVYIKYKNSKIKTLVILTYTQN